MRTMFLVLLITFISFMTTAICYSQEAVATADVGWLGGLLSKIPWDIMWILAGVMIVLKFVADILDWLKDKTDNEWDNKAASFLANILHWYTKIYDYILNNTRPKK